MTKVKDVRMTVLDPGMVDGRVSARTRAILLVTPHNPTGVVFSRQSLEGLGKIAARHGLLVINSVCICHPRPSLSVLDDPYSPFVYGDNPGRSDPASIRSFDGRLAPHLLKVHDATLICMPQLFDCVSPQGAYYVFPKITGPQTDSRAFSIGLLEEIGVAVTPAWRSARPARGVCAWPIASTSRQSTARLTG
jgi:aspartate/methionine/tyrosine aminotransferase